MRTHLGGHTRATQIRPACLAHLNELPRGRPDVQVALTLSSKTGMELADEDFRAWGRCGKDGRKLGTCNDDPREKTEAVLPVPQCLAMAKDAHLAQAVLLKVFGPNRWGIEMQCMDSKPDSMPTSFKSSRVGERRR